MSYAFGSARKLYTARCHPRLHLSAADLEGLRRKTRSGWGQKILDALRRKVGLYVRTVEGIEDMAEALGPNSRKANAHGVFANLPDLALVGVLDRDPRIVNAVRRILNAIPETDRRQGRDRLSYAYGGGVTVSVAYDLVHAEMEPSERAELTHWLYTKCVRETLDTLRNGNYLRHPAANIPMYGMISAHLAVLAIEGDPGVPDLSAEKAELLLFLEASLRTMFGPEGYTEEDIGYGTSMACLISFVAEPARRAGLFDAYQECPGYTRFGRALSV